MRNLIAVFAVRFPLAAASAPAEPPNVTEMRRQFLSEIAKLGDDPHACKLEYSHSDEHGHYVMVKCAHKPHACLFQVHPTEVLQRPLRCVPNPEYVKPGEKF